MDEFGLFAAAVWRGKGRRRADALDHGRAPAASAALGDSTAKAANLIEDEPALMVRMIRSWSGSASPPREAPLGRASPVEGAAVLAPVIVEQGQGAGDEAGAVVVGAAGQDDRNQGAEHQAGGLGAGDEGQLLGQHVAGFEIGHDQHIGVAGDQRG